MRDGKPEGIGIIHYYVSSNNEVSYLGHFVEGILEGIAIKAIAPRSASHMPYFYQYINNYTNGKENGLGYGMVLYSVQSESIPIINYQAGEWENGKIKTGVEVIKQNETFTTNVVNDFIETKVQ